MANYFLVELTNAELISHVTTNEVRIAALQEQMIENRDDMRKLTDLMLEIRDHFRALQHGVKLPASAGNSPLASPVADLRGLNFLTSPVADPRPPSPSASVPVSAAPSAPASDKSGHSGN
jgi:hypothetical protein